jgi:tetratricopeptide (TPR) repeat protein
MCEIKKLCTCDEVSPGEDHWKLEFHYGQWPSWGELIETRPEHKELAESVRENGGGIMGPMPMPMFKELYHGIAEPEHLKRAIAAEENWLNERNQFDFEYEPFEGDRLMFFVGVEEIAFSFKNGKWLHRPHQAYSRDHRMRVDAVAEDRAARERAASYFRSRYEIKSATAYNDLKELGDRFYKAKKWEQAAKAYEEAEDADPLAAEEDDDFCFNRGFALIELGKWADAQYAFEQCTAVAPENAAAWTNLGLCHRNLEDWQEGLAAYETATELAPGMINAWKGLAICAGKLNNKAQHLSACEVLVDLLPDDSHWRNELGRAHLVSGESSGVWRALAAFLTSARLSNDPCHPNNAAFVFRKLDKWLDAGDAYREALNRKPGYATSEKGLKEVEQRLERLSAKVRDFAASLPPCKQPYERYLNPFEILAFNGPMAEMPDGAALRKLKQRVIQQIQLNDGCADWLEGAEIGESRVRQILDDLDDESGKKSRWHWIIYECAELNRFLSHGDPLFFAFYPKSSAPPLQYLPLDPKRPPYWQVRDKSYSEEDFYGFIPHYTTKSGILTG